MKYPLLFCIIFLYECSFAFAEKSANASQNPLPDGIFTPPPYLVNGKVTKVITLNDTGKTPKIEKR